MQRCNEIEGESRQVTGRLISPPADGCGDAGGCPGADVGQAAQDADGKKGKGFGFQHVSVQSDVFDGRHGAGPGERPGAVMIAGLWRPSAGDPAAASVVLGSGPRPVATPGSDNGGQGWRRRSSTVRSAIMLGERREIVPVPVTWVESSGNRRVFRNSGDDVLISGSGTGQRAVFVSGPHQCAPGSNRRSERWRGQCPKGQEGGRVFSGVGGGWGRSR